MAIPNKPFVLDVDPTKLTVGDIRLTRGTLTLNPDDPLSVMDFVIAAGDYLIRHSNWDAADVNQLTVDELTTTLTRVREQEREASVPNMNSVNSERGHEVTRTEPPNGSVTSPTPSNSDVTLKMLPQP